MNLRRFFGNALFVLGVLNILNFMAPQPIPTVGISAFIFGGLLIGAGLFIKGIGAPGAIQWRRLGSVLRGTGKTDAERRHGNPDPSERADPLLAVRVLRLAEAKDGCLTVAQTSMELNVPLDASQAALDECVLKGGAYIDIDAGTGIALYRFPEFLTPKS